MHTNTLKKCPLTDAVSLLKASLLVHLQLKWPICPQLPAQSQHKQKEQCSMTGVKSTTYYNPLPTAWCLSAQACECMRERERVSFLTINLIPQQPGKLNVFWNSAYIFLSFDPVLSMQHLKKSCQQSSKTRSLVWCLWILRCWSFSSSSFSSWKAPCLPCECKR